LLDSATSTLSAIMVNGSSVQQSIIDSATMSISSSLSWLARADSQSVLGNLQGASTLLIQAEKSAREASIYVSVAGKVGR
jgi:hypothetical protein